MDEGADKQEQEGLIATPTAPTPPTHPVPTAEDNPAPTAATPTSPDDDAQYEREDVQKKTFAKWINSQLAKGQHPPVTDLFYDLRDGTRLLALLEVLTNKTYKREKGRMRVHHLNNVSRALSILEEHNVKLINISNEHIVDGSAKLTLGLVWAIILHWQVQGVLKDVMSDLQQTNLEKTLLAWCRQTTKGYHGVDVRNFTTSWTDGLAFNALIHSHRPQLFDWTVMARKHPYARLENAFRLANEHFNIERLLDPEDVNSQVPDKKSIMMYVMCLFQALPHGSFTMESLDVSIQSDSSFSLDTSSENVAQASSKGRPLSNVSIGLGEYQRTLEEVLTWLLGAEDRLAVMPPIANTTEEVKDQFHDLEELMLELTSKQGGIGDVLGEGSRLLKEGVMEEEEEEEVRVQMKLLNTRWEELRVKAMDRQSRLHEKLMTLQQTQLESLKKWLTETEDRIANMSQVGPTTDLLREQIAAHQSLQEDLENEQANINSLSNMVVVVDESSSDSAYSSLEDELNALGERWAHICRWAESRWKTLQTLSVHWTHYEQEMNKMGEWMNEKESLLREVESNPSSDQEHILRQASMLQIVQAEMEVQHRRFEHLQEESAKVLSHLPQDSPGQEKIPSELEMVQDRLDCLVSIIEAQTQRMAANGIDIKKIVIPADNTSDIVSSSTTTISHEDATVVTKIITTKIVTTETVEGSVIKRQKLEGGSQEDFSVALHQLGGWMDSLEAEVRPKVAGELTIEQLMQLAQQLENEIEGQKEEYYKVVSLGQSAISETSTIGESAKESEQQVAGITSRWEALNAMLIEIRTRITFLTEKKKVTTQLSDLEVQYEGFLRWCEDVRTVSENEPNAVSLQIEQCQSKIAAMESHEAEIGALKVACEGLDGKFAQETQPVMEQVQIFITKWEALKTRLIEWNVTLKERLGQVSPSPMVVETVQTAPPESLVKAMEASRKWLESLETALAAEHVVSSLPQMQDMLLKFQDLSQKVEMEQGNMKHINDACTALIKEGQLGISDDFTKLNKQWETTTEALQSRIKAIEKVIEKEKQYNDEVSGLCSWMSEVDVFLQAEEPALGDIETLEAQLEQSNALQDDIVTLENNVANITTSGKQLMEEAEPELKGAITVQLDELTKRWALVTELAKAQNKSLKDALAKSQKVHEDIQALNTWLDEMDQKVPAFAPIETSSELSAAIDMFNKLREEISEHSEEFRGVNNTGNEMLQHDAAATHEELARQFTQLNGRWTDVVTQVDSRHRVLSTASEQYDDFKKLCGEETEWLNQLQEKLEKSSKSAADAEEISEALDDLEIFLHSHNESRLEQIRNLAEALVQENCMSVAVQNATHTLTSRFDTLNAQASEHQSGLEGRVQEAQAWEREYVSVLDYLVQSDMVLTQAITDSQLRIDPVQVQTELVKQQEVLKKMQAQVDVYRTQGKTEAALRLEDQVTHLLKKYEEVEMKLRLCQKPSDFDDRLQQMNQELKDISQRVHLVTVTSGDPEGIQEQLNQCMALYQRLSEVKAEVESVIATGRKIVKEGQALDPETLTLQLDQLKGLYNQLGGTVTEHRGVLERALRHSRKIHKDSSHLEEWLSTTECELDQREATIPTRNVEGEVHFAQHAIDDLGRKRPLLTGLHESYAALASMCDDDALLQPIKEQVDDIALTWERVNTRLANRLKNMQSEQVNKEAEMEKFIVGLGEIKGWLQSTEYQLTNLSKVDADEQARIIKSISTEVQNYKGHIENIRDTAVDLINHGALFQARVQPELIEINQRWENIFKNVQQCSQDIQGTSLTSVTLTAETQGSRPSPSQTNTTTTTNLSTFSTSDVHETSVTTSLTSTTTQLIHTMGTTQVSDELMVHVHQQDDASTPVQSSWAGDNTSKNEEQEKGASLRSIGLVKSVMSTGTTLTSPVIDESETMEDVTESKLVQSVEGKPVSEISETHRETDENDVPIPGLKTVDVSDSMEMFSSADSARWGESSLVDSVIKVEPKENQTADEDHTLTLVTNTVTKKVDRSSSEMEGIDTETVKYVLDEQPSDDTEQKKMSLVEVEEVKMTISHLSFNIAGTSSEKKVDKVEAGILACGSSEESPIDSSLEVSPTAEYPPNSLLSSDLSSRDSPGKDRKRKITENDDDLDNFDELIAGLKEVAEKDITLSAVEKNRRRSAEKELDQDLSGDERFSLLKIRRRDDDDLESLASVDTDMAPASETSRDFEGTFSDLESVTESVSSKGDNLFAPMGAHGLTILDTSRNEEVSTVEFISQQTQLVTSEAVTHAYISSSQQLVSPESKESLSDIISAKISSISSGVTSDNKQSVTEKEVSEKDIDAEEESHAQKDYEQLPVEKLQAMIAELEEVMSDAELSDTEDEEDPQRRSELPAEKMDVSENIQRSKTEQLPIKDVVMKDDAATEVMEEILAPDIDKTNNELSSTEKDEPITDLSVIVKERSLAKDEVKCEADPIEFRVQEVHVGDVEFAQAKGLFEKDPGSLETPASVVKITTPLHDDVSNETSSMTSTNKTTEMSDDKDKSVQKVSVQSSQVVHGITYVSSTENRLPEAEEAVLVTLISRPSSAEVMTTDTESAEGKALMELVEEEGSEADVVVPDTEKSQEGTSGAQGTVESLSATSSSSSDEDDSKKKERRPTVIECPSFSVASQEGGAENYKKVNPACEIDNSSLGSVAMSTGQHSVPSTIQSFAPSEGVSDQFSVLSQKNVSGDGDAPKKDMTPITMTHVSSGISSSMMDFFSRHNVLIVDTDAKGQDGTVTVEPMEEDEGKIEEAMCLNISGSEAPIRSPSPIQTLGSEIMQDLGNIRETVQKFSSSVTSSTSSTTTVGAVQTFTSPAEMWSHFTRDMPSVMNIQSMQFQFPVAGNKSKVGRNVPIVLEDEQASSDTMSDGNLESQPVLVPTPVEMSETAESTDGHQIVKPIASSEMQYPTVSSKPQVIRDIPIMLVEDDPIDMDKTSEKTPDLPHERQGIAVSCDAVTGGDGVSKDISDTLEGESNVKEDISNPTQNITEKLKDDETAASLMLSDSSHSGTSEIQTQMIEASDVESGSLIEVIYQVEGSKGRRKAVVTPPDEAGMAELLQEASQSDTVSKGSQNISSQGASSRKISVASQSMILAEQEVVENITVQTELPEACVTFQDLPTNIADDMVTPLSTEIVYTEGAVPQDVERKVSVGSMEVSVSLNEVAGNLKIPDQPAQSFAHERQTSLAEHEQFSECVVTKSDDILLMDVESLDGRHTGRKISTASMEVHVESGEIAGTLVTGSGPPQSFAAERQASLTADNMKDFVAVRSEVVQVAGPFLSSEELIIPDIQSGLMTDSNRASPREENLEKLPTGFIDAEMMESQMSQSQSNDSFSSEDQLSNPFAQNVGQEASENMPSASKSIETERKISTATEEFTFAEQEVVSAISTPLLQTQSFTYPQDISLTVKENLAEGAVLSSVIQMKNSCPEEDKQVERKLSTATKAVEVIPYEIPEAVGTAGVETRAFALERSASETGREILKEAVLVSPETILQGTPQECESREATVRSSAPYLVATDFAQRKISVASDLEVLEVIERPDQFEPLIEQSLTDETTITSTEGLESVNMKDLACKAANESGRKISTASMEIQESYSEALCEKQLYLPERYACTVEVPELYSCKDDVITTSVKAVVSDGNSKMEDPGTKAESSRNSLAISEVSEEGIPLGCEAALIDPNLVTGFEIKSLSGEGTDFEDISVDEIAFITGVKSAMPAGYTFRTNTAEDDTMSEALSYYDLDNSFAVKDRYGVAVTVSGTLEGTEALVDEGGEEKQIPLEEGGIEELVMEPSFNALLKSSRHSSRGASLDNLFDSGPNEEGAGIEKICNEEPEVASANRSTFLTEVETSSHKHFADVSKVEKYQYPSVTSISSSQDTTSRTTSEIAPDTGDKKKSSETIVLDSAVPGESLAPGEAEMPFVSTKEVRKPDIKLDRLNSLSDSVPIKKEKSKEAKTVKKAKITIDDSPKTESKLQYTPFVPPGIKYGHTVKDIDDDISKTDIAQKVMEKEMIVKECYTPHQIPERSERSEDKSISLIDVPVCPEGLKVKDQITEDRSTTEPTVLSDFPDKEAKITSVITTEHEVKVIEQTNIQTLSISISNGEDHKTITRTSEVRNNRSTVSEKEKDSIPAALETKDSKTIKVSVPEEVHLTSVKEISKKEGDKLKPNETVSLASQKKTGTIIQYVPHVPLETGNKTSEAQKPVVTDSKPKIHYVPHVPSDLLKESCEVRETSAGKSPVVTEAKIMSTKPIEVKVKKDVKLHYVPYAPSDILKSIPEEEKNSKEVSVKTSKMESLSHQTNLQQQKNVKKTEKELKTDAQEKIQYVPHVPIKAEAAIPVPTSSMKVQEKTTKNILIREEELNTVKETAIMSDDEEGGKIEPPKAPKAKTEKTEPIKINYVPCFTAESQVNVLAADKKTKSVIEAQVHVPAEKPKISASVSSKETIKDKEKSEIQYVPYASSDVPKASSGARPKEIHYVPHAPSDLERFKMQEPISKAQVIPSVIITSPSSCKLDSVVTSSSSIPESIKHEAGGTPKPAAVSFTKDISRQQTQTSSSTVTSVSKISHVYTTQSADKVGKEMRKAGDDEVDAYLREVTLLADKITELKNTAGTVPSYQEAKDKSESVKLETEEVITKINNIQSKSDDIVGWMNDVSKRLHLVNNDESQLEALEKEMADKRSELDKLNESGELLKKYGYEQIQPLLAVINTRWIELTTQFSQYRKVSLEKKTIVSSKAQQEVEPVVVPDFIASVNRLREAISAISRQLNANKLAGRRYDNLKLQEEELKTIKQGLETLKPRVDNLETERNNTIKNVTQTQSEQIRRVMDKLREEWAQVNRGYTERHALWLQCSETWRTLQKTIDDFSVWLSTIEERVQITANQPLPEAKITQKELEKQVTLKHRPSQTLQSTCKEVTEDMSLDDAKRLQERVDTLMKRWRALLLDLAARRERIAGEEGGKDSTSSEYEALLVWVDQAQALMDAPVNVTDEATLSAHSTMIQNHLVELTTKHNLLKKLKDSKPKSVTPAQLSTLETNLNKVAKTLPEYKNLIETKLGVTKTLVTDVEDLYKWTEEMRVKVALRNMTDEEIKLSKITLREKETLYENLDSTYWVLAQDTESKGLTVSVALKNRMNTIESRLKALQGQLYESSASATPPSPTSPAFSRITPEKADQEKVVGEKDAKAASKEGEVLQEKAAAVAVAASKTTPEVVTTTLTKTTTTKGKVEKTEALAVTSGTTVTSSVTSVIQNVIKFEESVFGAEGALRPPSPLVCPPKHAPDSSPVLILASLDKSILQIRDWLTLMEQMTRQQTVVVGDADDIRQLTEKQKNVLRELEGKKPQLDELVASADSLKDDASRTQLHQKAAEGDAAVYKFPTHSRLFDHLRTCFKVSKLREHWDETNSVVLARKTQLDAMYADTHKFDAKRAELETWLARMEARLERMAPVAHTADVLDQQIREQKGFHAEIHQYKHQVELFNQMTQRLIAIYQHDDTRRLKKITETINLRYSSLNSSIIARGKALHSAMNSLHNFDKALDKFASWMSEAESSTDILELEVDKLGPGRRDLQARAPVAHLKDLQSEIESHKDVLASLNATGQKLLGTLENQDEAVMLQRRLEEMNQRWNTLKHKSIAIRNRLEGNAENWNSLLLSLRELIEWVIRKDTELTALGPLVGDLNALAKFSDDLAAFRRVIDEKQPVIESNLKSGRQLIASEPPLSDTSDSEAGRELDGDARYRGDDNARDLTRAVRREVAKLSEKWAALRERAAAANAQADLACKKLGVLQKTVEEVSGRLEEAQKTVDTWGAVPQDPNLADQHVHNVRKFREGLAELQRGVDDVNDQAARFSAHNVPLTPANSAKLHDLNNRWKTLETTVNDRWRQVAGRSREVTPLTPAQLASSVSPPWERATTSNKVPYYINHDQESTHWDHPTMMDLLDSLTEFNHIKFSAYRTATKLRMLQKTLALDRAKMQMATDVFDEHGLRGQNDRLIDVGDMVVVLSALYANISADHPEVNTTLAMDLCLNWLLNVYDSQRTGQMRVLSFKIGIVCLCRGHLEEKYRYMFRLIADPNRLVDQRKLGLLLHDCVQVPRQLGEVAAFGGSNIEPSVRSCFTKAGKDRETIEAVHFLTWVQQEPQSLVWLAVLHRVAASENIQHQVKCNICKAYPIVGLRYRCLKCLSFDMCQRCFFDGRSGKSHKITHPMHEYCTATTAGEDVKDFTKALKNKFKSKRALQKHTKKGYLPVQTVLEGDPLESPSPSPQHNVTSQDMHSRLELYASRLAEVELRTNSNSTPDRSLVSSLSEDEHGLIAQYCQSLSSSDAPLPVPRSPLQIMAAVDAEQKDELEQMIRALEEENSQLQAEYDRLKSQQPVGSPPDDGLSGQRSEADMLAEAKLLRQHKGRLEARMGILEEHNRQLEAQLHRLRQLLGEPGGMSSPNKSGTLQTKSVTASQLAMDSPAKVNGHSNQGGASSAYEGLDQMSEYVRPPPPPMGSVAHVGNLFSRAGDLGKAVGTLVATMTHEGASDLPSDEEERSEASDTEEEKAV